LRLDQSPGDDLRKSRIFGYLLGVPLVTELTAGLNALTQVIVPDLWQQQAVSALRAGQDVVVHAPTGAGKTLIFELWSNHGKPHGQAIYTVPTRALANDKLAEWRARGWNVGIATGDLAENLTAPILVATLETQKNRLLAGEGPDLLVIDEYQLLRDPDRGLNYELALALAPNHTQLLLLSGSVSNPQDLVRWLNRLGRRAVHVRDDVRPVPLDEVPVDQLSYHVPSSIRGYWPRIVAKALAEDLGPILIFAPRRQMAEAIAQELARNLPTPNPLALSVPQKQLAGESLVKLLKCRVAYHHSGLSYGARAGVIEPLAKAGQLRVVVATMGLAAGINFSLRSVALAGESYRRDYAEHPLQADEILQMHGRAGRRGIDETGYVLITANEIRLREGYPCHLSRNGFIDWSALLGIMAAASAQGRDPLAAAVRTQERLFSSKPILLGVENSLAHPDVPCGLRTDTERARFVRKKVRELRNSRGEWQRYPSPIEVAVRDVLVCVPSESQGGLEAPKVVKYVPALSHPAALEKLGHGTLEAIDSTQQPVLYGRRQIVAEILKDGRVEMVKWVRRLVNFHGRHAPLAAWQEKIVPQLTLRFAQQKTPVVRWDQVESQITLLVSLADLTLRVPVDQHGMALWKPLEREVMPEACQSCPLQETCRQLPAATGVVLLWRRLGLVDAQGCPTRRGRLVSFFSQGDGLALAAALEDEEYPLSDLIYDLANLDAGFRFCGEDNRWAGRLALACQRLFGLQTLPGYLEHGVPPQYGAGAEQIVASVHQNPAAKHGWITELLGVGDIDRIIIEWRSRLRQISHAPVLDWRRWTEFQQLARTTLNETESPTLKQLPALEYDQSRRVDHRLVLRRH
jgi:superfamily II DNA/RNA helicase